MAAEVPVRSADQPADKTHQTSSMTAATKEETSMNRTIAFTALSLAIVLGGASGAVAASKKHNDAH